MSHELGMRSRLVLEKLGFELRPCFADAMTAPMPPYLQCLADQLAGYAEWRDVGEGHAATLQDQAAHHELSKVVVSRDAPFCFG